MEFRIQKKIIGKFVKKCVKIPNILWCKRLDIISNTYYYNTKILSEKSNYQTNRRSGFMSIKIANVGDKIVSVSGIKGIVEKVKENSVIVEIIENASGQNYLNNRTVVSHKKYMVLS